MWYSCMRRCRTANPIGHIRVSTFLINSAPPNHLLLFCLLPFAYIARGDVYWPPHTELNVFRDNFLSISLTTCSMLRGSLVQHYINASSNWSKRRPFTIFIYVGIHNSFHFIFGCLQRKLQLREFPTTLCCFHPKLTFSRTHKLFLYIYTLKINEKKRITATTTTTKTNSEANFYEILYILWISLDSRHILLSHIYEQHSLEQINNYSHFANLENRN